MYSSHVLFTFAPSFLVLRHVGICSSWEVDPKAIQSFSSQEFFFLKAIWSLSSQGELFPFSLRKLFPRGTWLGLPLSFFLPTKSFFFLGPSSLKKLPIGYFVAFIPFIHGRKRKFGKMIEPHTLWVKGEILTIISLFFLGNIV